jgi:hypothetical protein
MQLVVRRDDEKHFAVTRTYCTRGSRRRQGVGHVYVSLPRSSRSEE